MMSELSTVGPHASQAQPTTPKTARDRELRRTIARIARYARESRDRVLQQAWPETIHAVRHLFADTTRRAVMITSSRNLHAHPLASEQKRCYAYRLGREVYVWRRNPRIPRANIRARASRPSSHAEPGRRPPAPRAPIARGAVLHQSHVIGQIWCAGRYPLARKTVLEAFSSGLPSRSRASCGGTCTQRWDSASTTPFHRSHTRGTVLT